MKLLGLGKDYNLAEVFVPGSSASVAGTSAPGRAGLTLPARFQGRVAKITVEVPDAPPADPQTVIPLCPFLSATLREGGDGRPEPQWYQAIRCATYMDKGEKLAHAFGNKDPRYSEGGTTAKWQYALDHKEALGWPSCRGIADSGALECKTCPHRKLNLSPFKLPRVLTPATKIVKEVKHWWETLPEGYRFNKVMQQIEKQLVPKKKGKDDDDGDDPNDVEEFWKPLFQSPIVGSPWVQGPPHVGVNITVQLDKEKLFDAFIPRRDFTRTKIIGRLFDQNITPNSKLQPNVFEDFMGSWIERMNSYVVTRTRGSFGWREKEGSVLPVGFIFGGHLFKDDGTKEVMPITDGMMKSQYTPCGDEAAWHKAAALILDQNKPELEVVLAAAFAGPIMRILGEPGAHLAIWSSGSGAHKSTASKIAAAVWGHPEKSRETKGSSWKGAVKRLGDTVNLTAYWDDIADDVEMKRLVDTALQLCQGSGGTKLQQNREYHEVGDWKTLCVSCSNMSVIDWLSKKEGSTDFRINRVFEVQHIKHMGAGVIDNLKAMQIVGELDRNYGRVGLRYAELLANNIKEIFDLVETEGASFKKDVLAKTGIKEDSANRYWLCACVTVLVGTRLANEMGIKLNYDAIRARLVDAFDENLTRKGEEAAEGGTLHNTQNIINRHLKFAGAGYTAWTKGAAKQGGHGSDKVVLHQGPERGRELWVHAVIDQREIRISLDKLKDWCAENNISYSATLRGLRTHYGVDNKRRRFILGAGTEFQRGQEDVIVLPVPEGSAFETFLFAHGGRTEEQIT